MKSIIKHSIFLFFVLITQVSYGQNPPQVCARILTGLGQDSIIWQASPCTNFGGYVILGQENGTGPFVRLDTVANLAFVNINQGEVVWNYQVGMLCNGTLTNISQTVSNQRPVTPDLRSVSIVGGVPVVSWDPSPSPEVIGYQIYKENPYGSGNYFPYPTPNNIITGTSFTDVNATNLLGRYAIIAVSPCNKSLLGIGAALDGTTGPHTSMIVQGTIDTCQQRLNFGWNRYENWRDGVQQYEIWLSRNGGALVVIDTVSANDTSYVYSGAQDNDVLEFQIRAIEQNKANNAISNTLRFDVRVNRPMDFIHLTDLTVNTSDEIEISWSWDTDVDFAGGDLLRGIDSAALTSRLSLVALGGSQNNFTDVQVSPEESSYYYKIKTIDNCGIEAYSNIGRTILLQVEPLADFSNEISWSEPYIQYGTVQDYWLYKGTTRIAILQPNELSYIDELDVRNENEVFTCYRVVANMRLEFPDGALHFTASQSNKDCATQGSAIDIPNALSPNGENTKFRPVIVFGNSIQSYNMQIFDRYGALIFESKDLYNAWDGTKDGEPLRQGVYVYVIRYQAPNGDWLERKGTVMLVR